MEPPFITVLITGYNRKQFIRDAIQSYKDQISSISRELIVITNFSDKEIDEFVNSVGGQSISIGECSVGEMLYTGITHSKGEVIMFLDDDDYFVNDKIEVVGKLFKSDPSIIFVHNAQTFVDDGKHPIVDRRIAFNSNIQISLNDFDLRNELKRIPINDFVKIQFNLSSITIRKNAYSRFLTALREIKGHTDDFFFYSALSSRGNFKIFFTVQQETVYRIHESTSYIKNGNTRKRTEKALLDYVYSTNSIYKLVDGSQISGIILYRYFSEMFDLAMATGQFKELSEEFRISVKGCKIVLNWFEILPIRSFLYVLRRYFHAQFYILYSIKSREY